MGTTVTDKNGVVVPIAPSDQSFPVYPAQVQAYILGSIWDSVKKQLAASDAGSVWTNVLGHNPPGTIPAGKGKKWHLT
jgi:hypothetical protein